MRLGALSTDERIVIVAEIGNNHEGDFARAQELVRAAATAGVDAVKFQTYRTDGFVRRTDAERYARLSRWQLSADQFRVLAQLARTSGIEFFSSPLDLQSATLIAEIGCAIKIASGDNDFFPLIDVACASRKPVIISSGMTDLSALRRIVEHARERLRSIDDLAILHCVTSYPAPDEQVNLAAIPLLQRELACTIGYSDHTLGIDACIGAAALGARILEKHFTLDKHQSEFRDHQLSADPAEMKSLVEHVRAVERLTGRPTKAIQACEHDFTVAARRSIVAARDLPAGIVLSLEDFAFLRPAGGLSPSDTGRLVGKRLLRHLPVGNQIAFDDVER